MGSKGGLLRPGFASPNPTGRISKYNKQIPAFQVVLAASETKRIHVRSMRDRLVHGLHGYASWMKRRSGKIAVGLHLAKEPSSTNIMQQGRVMVREYILSRLRRAGMMTPKLETLATTRPSEVSFEIQAVGEELERMYPDLYKNVARQLNMTFRTEEIVENTFTAVAEDMFKDNRITWGKIIALFALAAGFATDCVAQGHAAYVPAVVENFTKFLARKLVPWIAKQGGWEDVVRTFRASGDASVFWILSCVGAIFGFAATVMSALDV